MHRRRFLAALSVGGLAALAGCSGPNGSLRMTLVDDDTALAEQYTSPVDEMPPPLRDFLTDVIEDGPRTWEETHPPFDRERPVAYDGAYYAFAHEIVDTRTEMQYVVEIDYDPERPVDGATVDYEDLPPVDRAAVDDLLPPPEDVPSNDGFDVGRGHRYSAEEEDESVLVPESQYDAVSYEGAAYPMRVEAAREVDVHTYRYTAERVAQDTASLAATARERYRFTLDDLTEAERDVVESAIDDTYRIESDDDPPEAFESLVARFRAHEAVRIDEFSGEWLARYDASDYWADVGFPYGETVTGTPGDTPAVTPPPE